MMMHHTNPSSNASVASVATSMSAQSPQPSISASPTTMIGSAASVSGDDASSTAGAAGSDPNKAMLAAMMKGGAGGFGNLSTPKFNDINEILSGNYGFPAMVPPVAFNGGFGDMSSFMGGATGAGLDGGGRFGGMSPHPNFYSPTMTKMSVDVSDQPHTYMLGPPSSAQLPVLL